MERDRFIRLMLVLSGLSPVFLLWAIRGVQDVPSGLWSGICGIVFVIPNAVLKIVIFVTRKRKNQRVVVPRKVEDHQEQVLTYLFAMILPLIEVSFSGWRDAAAAAFALLCTTFIFYKMELHYMNLFFMLSGYRIFELQTGDNAPFQSPRFVVITKRRSIDLDSPLSGYRLGGNVLMESPDNDREEF